MLHYTTYMTFANIQRTHLQLASRRLYTCNFYIICPLNPYAWLSDKSFALATQSSRTLPTLGCRISSSDIVYHSDIVFT